MTYETKRNEKPLKRLLFAIDNRPCPFGCTYCFARFETYTKTITLADVESNLRLLDGIDVVYPACDSDLFARRDYAEVLSRTARLGRSVSVSTKAPLSAAHIESVGAAQARLRGRGVIKIGVSVATKHAVNQLEPRSASYSQRMAGLQKLKLAGIPNCLVLRPLLPEIALSEYREVLVDAVGMTDRILLGDEWLDESNLRLGEAVSSSEIRLEPVNWLQGEPVWAKRVDVVLHEGVAQVAQELGFRTFESDLDLMADVIEESAEGRRSWTG